MSRNSERWQRLSMLFDGAMEMPRDQRGAWLAAECADDAKLHAEIQRMLDATEREGFLDETLAFEGIGGALEGDPATEGIAERLGRALSDHYRLEVELGRGGMGAVFLAHELKHRRDVVLKVLRPDVAASVGGHRFEAEVRIAAQLAHPHIVPLLDSGVADGLLYFVMPRIPGETLRTRLKRLKTLPLYDALRLLRDIADALAHAHAAGVVHRDLKPENVLCTGDHAYLLDFGIAQWSEGLPDDHVTGAGIAVGTPRYMAPEQASGRAVDHRADLYAWGLVAREMLLGDHSTQLDLATARSDVPETVSSLVYRCLAPDPDHRPREARTLITVLDAVMAGATMPVTPGSAPVRWRRRWPLALGAAAAATLLTWWVVRTPTSVSAGDLRMPIAVAPFLDESADSSGAIRARLAGAWITQGLHETGLFQVVPWPAVLQATAGAADPLLALSERVEAGTVVTGTFYETAEGLTLQVEVRDTRRGTVLAALSPVTAPRDSSALAIRLVRDRVMGALAARRDPRFAGVAAVLERPPTFESYRTFERALGQFNAQQYRESIDGFRAAFALDSSFISPVVYAAQAAWNTTQLGLLDTLLTTLDARRNELTDYHDGLRAFLRAVYTGDGIAAFEAASRSAAIAPESRAAYDAAVAAFWLGRPVEARARLEALSPDRGAMMGWPSYWTNLTHARHLTGDFAAELRAAREMRRRHPTTRVAWTLEARALAALRDTRAIDSLIAASDTLEPDVYWSQASVMNVAGEELSAHGDSVAGLRYLARAEGWVRAQRRRVPTQEDHLLWHGTVLHNLGRFAEARAVFALMLRAEPTRAGLLELEALSASRSGDPGAMERLPRPAPYDLARRLATDARAAAARGDARGAQAKMREALRVGYRSWPWLHGNGWRDFAGLSGDTALARLTGAPTR